MGVLDAVCRGGEVARVAAVGGLLPILAIYVGCVDAKIRDKWLELRRLPQILVYCHGELHNP